MIDLKATRREYEFSAETGYRFHVVAEFDPEWGWSASVTLNISGMKTDAIAVERLQEPAQEFLRQLLNPDLPPLRSAPGEGKAGE